MPKSERVRQEDLVVYNVSSQRTDEVFSCRPENKPSSLVGWKRGVGESDGEYSHSYYRTFNFIDIII